MSGITSINKISPIAVNNSSIKQNQAKVSENPQIKTLIKQKEELEKQIGELKENSSNSNNKDNIKIEGGSSEDDIIKNLQNQINEIEKEIATLKSEKNNSQTTNEDTTTDSVVSKYGNSSGTSNKIVSLDTSLNSIKKQYSVKQKLQDNSKVLENEIKSDKGRGLDTTKQEEALSNMKDNINQISNNIGKKLKAMTNKEDSNDKTSNNNIISSTNKKYNDREISDNTNYDDTSMEKSKNKDKNENTLNNYSDNSLIGNFIDKIS